MIQKTFDIRIFLLKASVVFSLLISFLSIFILIFISTNIMVWGMLIFSVFCAGFGSCTVHINSVAQGADGANNG